MDEWIPTSERLPEKDVYVLATVDGYIMKTVETVRFFDRHWYASNGLRMVNRAVTA